ncbi:C-type lectin [Plakobranchus ocellatus]|uniref:C-type lectin n=1 Tax=Plakobranchus ocellatus TaxID=259542 RepID=A0AAV3ZU59_9GAST|nr:C-type lectin [Plakobranchus ocellatus]
MHLTSDRQDLHLIIMSLLPIFLLLGVLMIVSVEGYVTYDILPPYGKKKYHVSKEFENFDLAKMNDRCKQLGGYLFEPNSRPEAVHVAKYVKDLRRRGPFYTGLTDEKSEGIFYYYFSNIAVKNIPWRWFQPDNWYNEDCVEIWTFGFNDLHCGKRGKYICEVPA